MDNKTKAVLKVAAPVVFALAILTVGTYYFSSFPLASMMQTSASPLHVAFVAVSPVCGPNDPPSCLTQIADISHNVYTNFGMNATRDYLFGAAASKGAFNVISVGIVNYSQVATDTCINNATATGKVCSDWTANGLTQAAGTVSQIVGGGGVNFGNVSISNTFTCTSCSNTVINATGLYNTTTTCATNVNGCVMFAEANFTAATLQTNDQINVTWFIWTQ